MGTVGLNFGSPTSGAGFNVSSTVAEIVSNLQNVETPWKNQLTALESQDSVISNLGSLFSNLSTDISQLTDFEGVLAQKEGSSSDTNVLELTAATSSAEAGTHTVVVQNLAQTSSGYMAEIANSSATLSGSITLQVGSGTAQTITLDSSDNTLAGLASAINASAAGITANVLSDANGTLLSLVSGTSGAGGNIVVTGNSLTAAASNTLSAAVMAGSGSAASSATFSPVATSSEDLTGSLAVTVGSAGKQTISMSDVDTAEGGTTLADLQQYVYSNSATLGFTASIVTNSDGTASLQLTANTPGSAGTLAVSSGLVDSSTSLAYTSAVAGSNANLTVDGVNLSSASNTVSNLIPGVTFQLLAPSAEESDGSLEQVQVVISNDNTGVESVVNQFVSDYNSLISAVNAQEGKDSSGNPEPLFGSPTLSLLQQELLSSINSENPNGALDAIANASDALSGSITLQVGSGTAQTIDVPSGNATLAGLASAINSADIGVTASVAATSSGSQLELFSNTAGSSGALTVTSAVTDATTSTALAYTGSGSDINSLTSLGISVNNDGSITFDDNALDSVLNTDYASVASFFQNAGGWGQNFSTMLNNAGSSSSTGVLALAASANSTTESTLNAEISKEQSYISAQQSSLTAELNQANQILEELPSELQGMNELYSAITGYNQASNG
jgi:flagellar hook-associated protein 2